MTNITVEKQGERILRLECIGHAGSAKAGRNIVCAAVSILVQNCANALECVAGVTPDLTVDEAQARIDIRLPQVDSDRDHDAQTILQTTVLGLTDLSQTYPRLVKLNIVKGRNLS